MDPLSVAGSVVGLISAGAQLIPMLYNLGSAIKDAPQHAQAAVSELGDITIVLTQLQKYIDGRAQASIQRLNLITVEHITATLTDCVMTYSDLDALLKSLHVDKGLKAWDRAVWLVKKDDVGLLITRLQNHKSTFGLMLQIIQCASMGEAETSMDRLCDLVHQVLQSNRGLSLRLRNIENTIAREPMSQEQTVTGEDEATLGADNVSRHSLNSGSDQALGSSISIKSGDSASNTPQKSTEIEFSRPNILAFEESLHHSRVYRHAARRHSQSSLLDDGRSTLAISICSSLTLGEVSKISVYALPLYAHEISNPECYEFRRMEPTTSGSDTGRSQGQLIGTKGQQSEERTLADWWNSFKPSDESTPISNPVFGAPLETSVTLTGFSWLFGVEGGRLLCCHVPFVIAMCGDYLDLNGKYIEGIFEIPGSPKRLRELQMRLDSPPNYGRDMEWTGCTVFEVGSLMLRYLLQLPEPIVPYRFYHLFREPLIGLSRDPVLLQIETYKQLVAALPLPNRHLLVCLLDLFANFDRTHNSNKMTAAKLAALFQPGILSHPEHQSWTVENQLNQTVLLFLIDKEKSFHSLMLPI